MRNVAVVLFACAILGEANAQEIPAPASIDDAAVEAWLSEYIETDGWTVIGADGVAVALGSSDGVAVSADGTMRARIRHEYYQAVEIGGQQVRSNLQTRVIDCAAGRQRVVAMSIYELNDMQGASQSREMSTANWSVPTADSLGARAIARVCHAPDDGERLR
jgi:hypothetical protein